MRYTQYTAESVSNGHPDKIADQISDAILDHVLEQDPNARVACETIVKDSLVIIVGEITAHANIDYHHAVESVLKNIYQKVVPFELKVYVGEQSTEIANGVDQQAMIGAGDQGIMYGYACNETKTYMPSPIYLAHQLMLAHQEYAKKDKRICPDAKAQVTVRYQDGRPLSVDHIVISTQHAKDISLETLRAIVQKEIINTTLPKEWVTEQTQFWINPSGSFLTGGPTADSGLTGRKLMVDTYGGFSLHGGGAFSGKDSTKVDRTAAYMARYVAKNIVAAGFASRCEVCLAYAIGIDTPVMVDIDTFGTEAIAKEEILSRIHKVVDFRPRSMIDHLGLRQPVFSKTAAYGHFGREDQGFAWEKLDLVEKLQCL